MDADSREPGQGLDDIALGVGTVFSIVAEIFSGGGGVATPLNFKGCPAVSVAPTKPI